MKAKKKPNAVTCDVVESAGMTRAVQLSKGVLTLLAASLVLGGIFWRVGLGLRGRVRKPWLQFTPDLPSLKPLA
jgi:hypothetical protein